MNIRIVVIIDENNGIGKNNQLLAHLPADLKHFKSLTIGHPVIMGRKTFESIGKPLPGRKNILISSQNLSVEGCVVAHSLQEALELAHSEQVAIIGGASIYEQAMNLADRLYVTRIHHLFEADAFFPALDPETWHCVEDQHFEADEKNPYPYSFQTYVRS